MLNEVILMGRLVRDPERRYTQTNVPVTSFTLAIDRDRKGPNGERGRSSPGAKLGGQERK